MKIVHKKTNLLVVFILFFAVASIAQSYIISGKVLNNTSKEPIPFANVYLKKSLKGTVSDDHGRFELQLNGEKDSLIVSAVGFKSVQYKLSNVKKKSTIKLDEVNFEIKEVSVKPKESRSYQLLELIHENEHENNTHHFTGIEGKEYHRTAIVFRNLDNSVKENRVFRSTPGAFIDDSDSTCSVPVLMEEVVNRFLIPADGSEPIYERLLSQCNSLDVFSGADMDDITNEMTRSQNFYKQFIPLLDKNFASPLSLTSRFYYKMWVIDSTMIDGVKHMRVDFRPRREKDLAFYGYFWVETENYALTEINVRLSPKANINYVKDVRIHNVYEKNLEGKWYYKKKRTELVINYMPSSDTLKTVNTYVSKVSGFRGIKKTDANVFAPATSMDQKVAQVESMKQDELKDFWNNNRFETLDSAEMQIYASIDSLKENAFIHVFDKAINMFLTGYWQIGKIDLGPYLDIYRHNKLEGHRVTIPIRTSSLFNENYTIGGYLGYGFKDEKVKYGAVAKVKIPASEYSILGFDGWSDVRRLGHNDNLSLVRENNYGSGEDNIISALTARRANDKISEKQYANLWYERDIRKGITTKSKVMVSNTIESPFVPFTLGDTDIHSIQQIAGSFNLRLAFEENHLDGFFRRVYLGNRFPVFNINLEAGKTKVTKETHSYFKLHTTIKHKIGIGMGRLHYLIEAGKIFGTVPFPFLEVHRGNETYGYARFNFNMLNYLEYVSDEYVNVYAKYDFGGFFLNNIPLIRALNLRELVSFKGILGGLSDKHALVMDFPEHTSQVGKPYAEIGVGLTNIFQYGHIEYVWRLSDRDKPGIATQGVRFRFEVNF